MVLGAWLALSAGLALRLLVDVAAGWRTVRRSRPAEVAALVEALRLAAIRIGAAQPLPRLHTSGAVASPALWGWSRPAKVLVPEAAALAGDCEAVFCHELAHLRRRDHWTALLAELLVCALPWHPLAWLTRRGMAGLAEEACDDWAVACGCPPLDYAEALVGLTPTATPALTVAAVSRRSPLATRVRRLLAGGLRPPRLGRGWLAGATLGALLLATAWALWQPRRAAADPPAHSPKGASSPAPAPAQPAQARTLRVAVLDPRGKPVPAAKIHANILSKEKDFKSTSDYETDAAGAARVRLPGTFFVLQLWASKRGFAPMYAGWDEDELARVQDVPVEYAFKLESPVAAGGRILDEGGRPIAGARVQVRLNASASPAGSDGRVRYNSWLAEGDDAATTDAEGRWRIDNVPDHPQVALGLLVTHPEYISDGSWEESQKAAGVTTAMLRQRAATLTLRRGVIVRGRVTDPAGAPVKDALVIHGDGPYFAAAKCDFRVDADGRFRLPALAPRETTLTVIAPGWAPQLRRVKLHDGLPAQDFRMTPGRPIRLRVVDEAGKPMPRAEVIVAGWQGKESLHNHDHPKVYSTGIPRNADAHGVWEWTWAPEAPVKLQVGWMRHAYVPLEIGGGGPTRTVVLKPEHRITGRVTDAMTGRPIPAFTVIPIDVFRKDWLHAERFNAVPGEDGRLDYLATRTDIALRLRVEAEGYRTEDGPEFRVGDDAARTQDFRLRPSRPAAGSVVDADGRPVAKAEVLLATPTQEAVLSSDRGNQEASTDEAGRFAFPHPGEPWTAVARADAGYALAESPADRGDAGVLRLRPWASVRGRFLDGGRPVRNARIFLQPVRIDGLGRPRVDGVLRASTDGDGRFEFPRVPPCPVSVRVFIGPWKDEGFRSGPSVPLDLRPGQHAELDLGGEGAVLTGVVKLTGKVPADLDCTYSLNYLVRREPGIAPPPAIAALGFDVRNGWRDTWAKTSEGLAYLSTLRQWFVKLAPDGTFRVSGVPPGEYDLAVDVYAKPSGCLVDPLARRVVRVSVTEADAARGALALPEIAAEVTPVPAVGDSPRLSFRRADDAGGTLADHRGEYTVVHFWASWCGPCKQQLPVLRTLHDRFAARGLATVGLSLDEDPAAWQAALKVLDLPWPQGRVADASDAGVSSVPAYWLLDPAGKIVAKASDPDELAATLVERLK